MKSVGRYHFSMWPNRDPIGIWDGPNILLFAHNSPLNLIDKNGLESFGLYFDKSGRWAYPHGLPNPFHHIETPPQQPAVGPYKFLADVDTAGLDLAQFLADNPEVDKDGELSEQSATIFRSTDGQCYYTFPKTGVLPGNSPFDLKSGKLSESDEPAGHGHSHVRGERFSDPDIDIAIQSGVPLYLLTPSHRILKYDPLEGGPGKQIGRAKKFK